MGVTGEIRALTRLGQMCSAPVATFAVVVKSQERMRLPESRLASGLCITCSAWLSIELNHGPGSRKRGPVRANDRAGPLLPEPIVSNCRDAGDNKYCVQNAQDEKYNSPGQAECPHPTIRSGEDLALMRRIDEVHQEHPFAGARMLRDMLRDEGHS